MQTQKILKYVVFIGLFLIPFTVLHVSHSLFFPFITGKAFYYRIIVEIVAAAWLILALYNPDFRPYKQKIYYSLLGILGVLFLSNILSEFAYKAFWSNFERMDGWIAMLHHVLLFVVISSVFTTYKMWKRFWNVSLAVSVIVCFYGFLQYVGVLDAIQGSGIRIDGTFGNAAYLAVYNLFNIALAVWFLYRARHKGMKALYIFIGLFNLFNLYATATRGVILGLAVSVFVTTVLVFFTEKENKKIKYISGAFVLLIMLAGATIFALRNTEYVKTDPVLSRIASISLESGSTRFTVWKMALNGVTEKPVIGWGQEGFVPVFAKYYTPNMYGQEPWFDRAHNIVLDWLISGGIVGFLLYLSLFYFGITYLWKSEWLDSFEKSVFTGLYVGYFFQNLFVFDNIGSYIFFFTTLAFFTAGNSKKGEVMFGDKSASSAVITSAKIGVAVILICSIYIVNIKPITAGQQLIRALTPGQTADSVLEAFKSSLEKDTFATPEVVEQMMVNATAFLQSPNASDEAKQEYLEVLTTAINKEVERRPRDARLFYAVGVFYSNIGAAEQALAFLTRAAEISPQKQIILFELGFAHIANGNNEEGLRILKEAFELETDFMQARQVYAIGAMLVGDRELEQELLSTLPEDFLYTDERIIQVYAGTGRFSELADLWRIRIQNDPKNIQNYVSLAATYVELGDRAQAISVLQEAIEAEPQFKEQGEKFIQDIQSGAI